MSKYRPSSSGVRYVKDDPVERQVKKIEWLVSQNKSNAQICEILEEGGELNLDLNEVSWTESVIQDIRDAYNLGKPDYEEKKPASQESIAQPIKESVKSEGKTVEQNTALIECVDCGSRISRRAVSCPSCGAPNAEGERATRTKENPYLNYDEVPWFRRSSTNSVFLAISFFSAGWFPGVLLTCIIILTGDIYYNDYGPNRVLKKWRVGNKVVAVILLFLNIFVLIYFLTQ